jgi:hypothetical protein
MWQDLIVAVLVLAAAVYAARSLGPRRWRRRASGVAALGGPAAPGAAPGAARDAAGPCGCGKDGDGCH